LHPEAPSAAAARSGTACASAPITIPMIRQCVSELPPISAPGCRTLTSDPGGAITRIGR
jgi:hypothetical protein